MLKRLFAVLIEVWSISMVLFMIEVLPNLLHLVLFGEISKIGCQIIKVCHQGKSLVIRVVQRNAAYLSVISS